MTFGSLLRAFVVLLCGTAGHDVLATPGIWENTTKFVPENWNDEVRFGWSAAVGGDTVVLGGLVDSLSTGQVAVFDRRTGEQRFKCEQFGSGYWRSEFGSSVATDGNVVAAGAPQISFVGETGAVFLYDAQTGAPLHFMQPDIISDRTRFGHAVDIDAGELAVGATRATNSSGLSWGRVYLFDIDTGRQTMEIPAAINPGKHHFGGRVRLTDDALFVSYEFDEYDSYGGFIFGFDRNTGELLMTIAPPPDCNVRWGSDMDVRGDLLIGATSAGRAALVDRTTGETRHIFVAPGASDDRHFGRAVALGDDVVLIAGRRVVRYPGKDPGKAWLYDARTYELIAEFIPDDLREYDEYGYSVAADGPNAVVAAWCDDDGGLDVGGAYLWQNLAVGPLTVEPYPLIAGQPMRIAIEGAQPNERTWLLSSRSGLSRNGIFIEPLHVIISLAHPVTPWGPFVTDSAGNLRIVIDAPSIRVPSVDLWFQAAQDRSVTNIVPTRLDRHP